MRAGSAARRHIVLERHRHRIARFEPQSRPVLQSVQTRRVHVVTSQLHAHADVGVRVRVLRYRDGRRQRTVFYFENMRLSVSYVLFEKKVLGYVDLSFSYFPIYSRARRVRKERAREKEVRIERQA